MKLAVVLVKHPGIVGYIHFISFLLSIWMVFFFLPSHPKCPNAAPALISLNTSQTLISCLLFVQVDLYNPESDHSNYTKNGF